MKSKKISDVRGFSAVDVLLLVRLALPVSAVASTHKSAPLPNLNPTALVRSLCSSHTSLSHLVDLKTCHGVAPLSELVVRVADFGVPVPNLP